MSATHDNWRDAARLGLFIVGVEADGALICGAGFGCGRTVAGLEAALDRPVATANQASLWRCLALAGVTRPIKGFGRFPG